MRSNRVQVCRVCGREKAESAMLPVGMVRPSVADEIEAAFPGVMSEGWVCNDDIQRFRSTHIEKLLEAEKGELTRLDRSVLESIGRVETIAADASSDFDRQRTFGERVADGLASFGGSWKFLILFGAVLVVWITINAAHLLGRPFDPFPFILLNLILSCLAAIQAPVIMMSQNRQDARDRLRSENDYVVNLKAELEIRQLHEKIDHLLAHQWSRLVEIQQIQMDVLSELGAKKGKQSEGRGPVV